MSESSDPLPYKNLSNNHSRFTATSLSSQILRLEPVTAPAMLESLPGQQITPLPFGPSDVALTTIVVCQQLGIHGIQSD
ncbi:hypothetical protein [Gimesia sp.]|uniref:hypothetical protein n=1 Tax=Gimesia sp. TaxID=2024833 RepID=UPI0032EDDF28